MAAAVGSGESAVVVTSGGVLAALCVGLLDLPPTALMTFNRVCVNTGVTKVAHGRRGSTLVSFNEHAHVDGDAAALLTYR